MLRRQATALIHYTKVFNKLFENVANIRHFEIMGKSQNSIPGKIKSRINSGNSCCPAVQKSSVC
jgi:hypothetical protein